LKKPRTIKEFFRKAVLGAAAVAPVQTPPKLQEVADDHLTEVDPRPEKAIKRRRLWGSVFASLTPEQQRDPEVQKLMPWNYNRHDAEGRLEQRTNQGEPSKLAEMAKLTEGQWMPKTEENE